MINSKQNQYIKLAKSLGSKKSRTETRLALLEGPTLVEEALAKGIELEIILHTESYVAPLGQKTEIISEELLAYCSDTQSPNQVLAIAKQKNFDTDLSNSLFLLYCENIQDPGNLGSIIRSAVAAGVEAVILSEGCVDIYNPKCLRASMGALFYIPVLYGDIQNLPHQKIASSLKATQAHTELETQKQILLMVGNESQGLSPKTEAIADDLIKIQMANDFESLNVVAATSILLFDLAHKQGRLK